MTFRKLLAPILVMLAMGPAAQAAEIHFEGFEDPAWTPGSPNWANFSGGDIQRVASGTNGIASSDGSAHAIVTNLRVTNNVFSVPTLGARSPFTQFGGYSSTFGDGFMTSLDIYLDPVNWTDGQGFDYSVAVNNQSGTHLRDFIAHVGMVNGELLFNASNNSDLSFNAFKLTNENAGNSFAIAAAGWYTFEHVFADVGGVLSVDINLLDDGGALLHSLTRSTSDDIATEVGGNRYGWLVYNNVDGLALDNTRLSTADVSEPESIALMMLGLAGAVVRRRRTGARS